MRFGPVATDAAEGLILAHSLALPSGTIRKGHRLAAGDIEAIRDAGIASVIAAAFESGDLGEDEAATRLASLMAGQAISARPAATGRVNLYADQAGVLVVDRALVDAFNAVDPAITLSTLPEFATVTAGQMVATVKIIPFAVAGKLIAAVADTIDGRVLQLQAFRPRRVAMIQTRLPSVKSGILDKTVRVTQNRLDRSGSSIADELRTAHDAAEVARAMTQLKAVADMILVFGASAVCDEHDVIPAAIRLAGGSVDRVGMPVDPGNLLVLGSIDGKPVLGAPGCARSQKLNGFDWVLDRLMADLPVLPQDIARMGVGGLLMEIPTRPQPREPKSIKQLRIDAILLAAGRATRMEGTNKLLSRFDGIPLVRKVAEELSCSPVASIVVVTGHQSDRVTAALGGLGVRTVENHEYRNGLSSSLKTGIAALPKSSDGVLVCLADMPGIRAVDLNRLVEAFVAAGGKAVIRAASGNTPGNPVILPRALFAAAELLEGDRGAKRLIEQSGLDVVDVDIGDAALRDVDTPHTLAEAGGEPAE